MVTFVAIIALLFLAAAIVGVLSLGFLALLWGPAAYAFFASFVLADRIGVEAAPALCLALLAFVIVRILTGQLLRAGLRTVGVRLESS